MLFIFLVGFGQSYNICTIGEQRDVDEGRLCLGGLQYQHFQVEFQLEVRPIIFFVKVKVKPQNGGRTMLFD